VPETFIQIVEPADVFPFTPVHPDTNEPLGSTLYCRVVDDDTQEGFRRKRTTIDWRRGQRQELLDNAAFVEDCLDYAITGWTGVYKTRIGADGKTLDRVEIPCERRWKALLPEFVKVEVVRRCVGKEVGLRAEGGGDSAKNA
jgi:hypothetical protein